MSNIMLKTTGALMPTTMSEAMQFAELISQSDMVPKDYKNKPANVLVAMQWGAEIGLAPLQSLQNIAVINGRPAVYGDSMLALVQGSGVLDYIHETIEGDGDNRIAVCKIKRKGQEEQVRTFSVSDAKQARLWGRKNRDGSPAVWSQYPERMMQMRARGFALRDVFADVLRGMKIAEEAQDIPAEIEDQTPEYVPQQKAVSEAKPEPKLVQIDADTVIEQEPEIINTAAKATKEQRDCIGDLAKQIGLDGRAVAAELQVLGQSWKELTSQQADRYISNLSERCAEVA